MAPTSASEPVPTLSRVRAATNAHFFKHRTQLGDELFISQLAYQVHDSAIRKKMPPRFAITTVVNLGTTQVLNKCSIRFTCAN